MYFHFYLTLIFITVFSVKIAGAGCPVQICAEEIVSQKVLAMPKNDMDVAKYCRVTKLPKLFPPKYLFHYACASSNACSLKYPVARGAWCCCLKPLFLFMACAFHSFFTRGAFGLHIWNSSFSQVDRFIASQIQTWPIQKTRGNEKHYSRNPPLSRLEVC